MQITQQSFYGVHWKENWALRAPTATISQGDMPSFFDFFFLIVHVTTEIISITSMYFIEAFSILWLICLLNLFQCLFRIISCHKTFCFTAKNSHFLIQKKLKTSQMIGRKKLEEEKLFFTLSTALNCILPFFDFSFYNYFHFLIVLWTRNYFTQFWHIFYLWLHNFVLTTAKL